MKRAILPIALVLAAAPAPAVATADNEAPAYVERSERAVDAAGLRALDVDNPRGRVELAPSADGRLHVVALKTCRTDDHERARRLAAETTVETSSRDGRYAIVVHYPHGIDAHVNVWDLLTARGCRGLFAPEPEVRLLIQAPPALAATVTTASGDVATRGMAGTQALRTASGEVEAADARGPIEVRTASGGVTLRAVGPARVQTVSGDLAADGVGPLEATSASGAMTVNGAHGALSLETVSGDIVASDAPAGVRARTTSGELDLRGACERVDAGTQSGNIRTRLRGPLREATVASVSGDVELELAAGVGATLDVRSTSGSIDCSAPVIVTGHDTRSLGARLGTGVAPVRIQTTSGSVSITSGGK